MEFLRWLIFSAVIVLANGIPIEPNYRSVPTESETVDGEGNIKLIVAKDAKSVPAEAKETKDLERGSKKLTGYLKKPRCFWPFVSSTDEKEETQKVESTREVMNDQSEGIHGNPEVPILTPGAEGSQSFPLVGPQPGQLAPPFMSPGSELTSSQGAPAFLANPNLGPSVGRLEPQPPIPIGPSGPVYGLEGPVVGQASLIPIGAAPPNFAAFGPFNPQPARLPAPMVGQPCLMPQQSPLPTGTLWTPCPAALKVMREQQQRQIQAQQMPLAAAVVH